MASIYQMPPPPMGRAGTTFPTTSGTWAWNGGTQQWTVLPSGTSQVYGWDGTSQSWVPVTGGGGTGMGVTDGSNAAPGMIGEVMTVNNGTTAGASIPMTAASPATWGSVVSVSLTAGDWDVSSDVVFQPPAGLAVDVIASGALSTSPTAQTLGWPNADVYRTIKAGDRNESWALPIVRVNVTATTTVHVIASIMNAGVTTPFAAWAYIYARRAR